MGFTGLAFGMPDSGDGGREPYRGRSMMATDEPSAKTTRAVPGSSEMSRRKRGSVAEAYPPLNPNVAVLCTPRVRAMIGPPRKGRRDARETTTSNY